MTHRLLCLSAVLLLAAPAYAGPTEDLSKVFTQTVESKTQTVTFFRGLSGLANFDVTGDALKTALNDSGISDAKGMLGAFLSGTTRISKKGDRIVIYRGEGVTLKTPNGAVLIPKTARFRVRALGEGGIKLDKMDGAKAGKSAGSLYPLRWLELSVDAAGITTAKLNAGYSFGFNKTVTIKLKRPKAAKAAKPAAGLTSLIPQ
jgi:hypothetical protein